jgi:hypothetical protein
MISLLGISDFLNLRASAFDTLSDTTSNLDVSSYLQQNVRSYLQCLSFADKLSNVPAAQMLTTSRRKVERGLVPLIRRYAFPGDVKALVLNCPLHLFFLRILLDDLQDDDQSIIYQVPTVSLRCFTHNILQTVSPSSKLDQELTGAFSAMCERFPQFWVQSLQVSYFHVDREYRMPPHRERPCDWDADDRDPNIAMFWKSVQKMPNLKRVLVTFWRTNNGASLVRRSENSVRRNRLHEVQGEVGLRLKVNVKTYCGDHLKYIMEVILEAALYDAWKLLKRVSLCFYAKWCDTRDCLDHLISFFRGKLGGKRNLPGTSEPCTLRRRGRRKAEVFHALFPPCINVYLVF